MFDSGFADSYSNWIGKYSGKTFDYFARHNTGRAIKYQFNSLGYRGPEHWEEPDITIFGSSFSFGVGIEFEQCWHQLLGDYRVNCYAPAGFLVTNNDIIDHYKRSSIKFGRVILQLREFKYNTNTLTIPDVDVFVIDQEPHHDMLWFSYNTFYDRAEDQTHPGPKTHQLWARKIKKTFNL